jgi:hypothetical protein
MAFASHVRHEEDCKKRGEGRETEGRRGERDRREERGERQKGGEPEKTQTEERRGV